MTVDSSASSWVTIRGWPRLPWVTLALTVTALALQCVGVETWQYTRAGVDRCEAWRLWTGHFVHWDASQLTWDLAMFVVLGAIVERRDRGALLAIVMIGGPAISLTLFDVSYELRVYRGLSGLDTALFATVATKLALGREIHVRAAARAIGAASLGLLFGKCVYEVTASTPLFVSSSGWSVVALAHLSGLAVGVAVGAVRAVFGRRRGRRDARQLTGVFSPLQRVRGYASGASRWILIALLLIWCRSYVRGDSWTYVAPDRSMLDVSTSPGILVYASCIISMNMPPGSRWYWTVSYFTEPLWQRYRLGEWTRAYCFAWQVRQEMRYIRVPILLLACPFLLVVLICGLARSRSSYTRKRGECAACGYDLRGTPGRCPECGAGYRIAQRHTAGVALAAPHPPCA